MNSARILLALSLVALCGVTQAAIDVDNHAASCLVQLNFKYKSGDLLPTDQLHDGAVELVEDTYEELDYCGNSLLESSSCSMTVVGGIVAESCSVSMVFVCGQSGEGNNKVCSKLDATLLEGKKIKVQKKVKATLVSAEIKKYGEDVAAAMMKTT